MTGPFLTITRRFDATPERVFDAWLDPAFSSRWLFTSPASDAHTAEHDARVGGQWTVTDLRDGVLYTAIGEYLEIDRPRRLVFSFSMPQFSPDFDQVIVEIAADGTGCILTLTQANQPSGGRRRAMESGWTSMLGALGEVLSTEGEMKA